MFNVGSCFSGIGGLELGLEATGRFKTLWQIENNPYATRVLEKNFPDVQRFTDIRDVSNPPAVDVICGGFPCQDVSMAGKRAGLAGDRTTLWGEMFRLVREVKPRWLLAENVPGLLSSDGGRFFGNILGDLARAGYDAEWGVLSAASVGAPHLRQRLFIVSKRTDAAPLLRTSLERGESNRDNDGAQDVADTMRVGGREGRAKPSLWRRATEFVRSRSSMADAGGECREPGREAGDVVGSRREIESETDQRQRGGNAVDDCRSNVADAARAEVRSGPEEIGTGEPNEAERFGISGSNVRDTASQGFQDGTSEPLERSEALLESQRSDWWAVEPNVGRVAHGVPSRVDRLRCLGNAVVPQVSHRIAEMILEAE